MMLWVIFAVMAAVAVLVLLSPLMRRGGRSLGRGAYDLGVYRDQLAEVARDQERGFLDADEAAEARLEVQRRMLSATGPRDVATEDGPTEDGPTEDASTKDSPTQSRPAQNGPAQNGPATQTAPPAQHRGRRRGALVVAAVIAPLAAFALYLQLGTPDLPGQPFAERGNERAAVAAREKNLAKINTLVAGLASRLEKTPDNLDGWRMLGRSYMMLGRFGEAAKAFSRARSLAPKEAVLATAEGEALVLENEGMVTPPARAAFNAALAIDKQNIRARFYLGLAEAQAGQPAAALVYWEALLADAPKDTSKDAPWLAQLRQQVSRMRATVDSQAETKKTSPD